MRKKRRPAIRHLRQTRTQGKRPQGQDTQTMHTSARARIAGWPPTARKPSRPGNPRPPQEDHASGPSRSPAQRGGARPRRPLRWEPGGQQNLLPYPWHAELRRGLPSPSARPSGASQGPHKHKLGIGGLKTSPPGTAKINRKHWPTQKCTHATRARIAIWMTDGVQDRTHFYFFFAGRQEPS